MRFQPRVIFICLLLGTIMNLAVAWAFAFAFAPPPGIWGGLAGQADHSRSWAAEVVGTSDDQTLAWIDATSSASERRNLGTRERTVLYGSGRTYSAVMLEAGWPFHSFVATERHASNWLQEKRFHMIVFVTRSGSEVHLPYKPLWGGMLFNTAFYAGLLWVLLFGPFALRRARRARRGLCLACAYPIGTSAICTECGRSVRKAN